MTIGSGVGHIDDDTESKLLVSLSLSVLFDSRFVDETYDESPDVDAPHVFGSAKTLLTKVVASDDFGSETAFDGDGISSTSFDTVDSSESAPFT